MNCVIPDGHSCIHCVAVALYGTTIVGWGFFVNNPPVYVVLTVVGAGHTFSFGILFRFDLKIKTTSVCAGPTDLVQATEPFTVES